jgi:hypothetical protein
LAASTPSGNDLIVRLALFAGSRSSLAMQGESQKIFGTAALSWSDYCMKWNSERRQIVLLGALMLTAISLGCSKSDLAAIKGRVKFKNGEAINFGSIEYSPTDRAAANKSGAEIVDGAYAIPSEKGLRAGKYVVRIYSPSFLLSPRQSGGAQGLKLPEERVSAKFNTESNLVIEVTHEAIQTFDFEVE